MDDPRGLLLPAYVAVDESGSMSPHFQELTSGLASLCGTLRSEPMIAAKLRLAVLGFSGDVQLRLPLSDMRTVEALPRLQIRGVTNYGALFGDLLHGIPADVARLKGEGYSVHRPVVFFLSDGQPTDAPGWREPHRRLTDRGLTPAAPNVIACGIGQARADTILEVATSREFAFVAIAGADLGQAISEFFHALTTSLVNSVTSLNSTQPELVVQRPEQFRLAIEEV
jgi:uncharacterized protein YegL